MAATYTADNIEPPFTETKLVDSEITTYATPEVFQYKDVQDDYFYTKDPKGNPFLKKITRQVTNIQRDERTVLPKDRYDWGVKDIKFQFDKNIQLLGPITIYVDIGPLTNGSGEAIDPTKWLCWVNGLGYRLFEYIEFRTDSNIPAQRIEPKDAILDTEIFQQDATRPDCPGDNLYFKENETYWLKRYSASGFTLKYRLKTWWTEDPKDYLAPRAIATDQFYMYCKISPIMDLVCYDGWNNPVIPQASITNLKMGQQIFWMSPAEESLVRSAQYSVQVREFVKTENIYIAQPVRKFIYNPTYTTAITTFFFQFRSAADEATNNVNRLWDCSDPCSQIVFTMNGKKRWDMNKYYLTEYYWKELFPYHPSNKTYVMPLGVDPAAPFMTGSSNLNQVQNSSFEFTFPVPWSGKIDIIADTRNYVTVAELKVRRSFY